MAGRAPVTWWKDAPTSRATQCFNYTPASGETVASVVDKFGLDMVTFIQNKHNNGIFGLGNVTIKFPNLRAEDMAFALRIVNKGTDKVTKGSALYKPYFRCDYYDDLGNFNLVTCNSTEVVGNEECARKGVASCSLIYWDTNVTEKLPPGAYLQVCNERWSEPGEFDKVAYLVDASGKDITEAEALTSIMLLLGGANMTYNEARNISKCQEVEKPQKQFIDRYNPTFTINWYAHCPNGGPLVGLWFSIFKPTFDSRRVQINMDKQLISHLLLFRSLQDLQVYVDSGQVPPELGSLKHLRELAIRHTCLTGAINLMLDAPHDGG
jgi:hypothetical protein